MVPPLGSSFFICFGFVSLCEPTEKERETVILGVDWGTGRYRNRQRESKA